MSMLIPNLKELVPQDHIYRALMKLINFKSLCSPLQNCYSVLGRGGYPVTTGFKCLLIQFMNDLSDRQLEAHLKDSLSAKLFCGFDFLERTPERSYFVKLRNRIGTEKLARMFRRINKSLKEAGYIKEVFTFIDASAIKSRVDVGKARDKDRWLSKVSMPYEGVFSCMSHTARYRGLVKIQFQAFMQALAYNLKRLVKIKAPPIDLVVC